MKRIIATLAMACVPAMAQQAEPFTPQQLKSGADLKNVPQGGSVWTFALLPE